MKTTPFHDLTAEEAFLWHCALAWRTPTPELIPVGLNWQRVAAMGQFNRMETLLCRVLTAVHHLDTLPAAALAPLQTGAAKFAQNAAIMGDSLHDYLRHAAERGIETAVLKGLSVSINTYGDPAMRPGGDIDILVRQKDVVASLEILDVMEIGQNWPNLMDDRYYERHHLHQQRCTPDLKLWYEIHWALDHPLTRLTIDYEGMMDRATAGTLLGAPVHDLSVADNLIALTVHLVKHAVYLPAVLHRPDLARIILADGMLMYFLDVAELIKQHEKDVDWQQLVTLCRAYGTVEMMGAVLTVCRQLLETPVPEWVIAALPILPANRIKQVVMDKLVAHETAVHLGQQPSRLWNFLLITNGAFILRPIRLLDLSEYLFPGRDYLQRRYGAGGAATAVRHFLRALWQYGRVGIDTVYFTWERYWRLRRLNYSTSLFNRLEVEA
ncbi:MAG: nucleotidyltransferase family protein [Ardenticatenaceae bacterium]|nr:nucleotidyltransferase family protein [Ardenticatenaceae bacterium]